MVDSLAFYSLWFGVALGDGLRFLTTFGAACQPGQSFFGFPTWYKYLDGQTTDGSCIARLSQLTDIWLIVLAVVEMLLRIAAIAAVIYVLYGGVKFITARGNPEKITTARTTVQDALIGLVIAITAIAIVNFVGGRF